jgi:tyrosinase
VDTINMHDSNVDRILALWQVVNPNSWVEPEKNEYGTFVIQPGAIENVNTRRFNPLRDELPVLGHFLCSYG